MREINLPLKNAPLGVSNVSQLSKLNQAGGTIPAELFAPSWHTQGLKGAHLMTE